MHVKIFQRAWEVKWVFFKISFRFHRSQSEAAGHLLAHRLLTEKVRSDEVIPLHNTDSLLVHVLKHLSNKVSTLNSQMEQELCGN